MGHLPVNILGFIAAGSVLKNGVGLKSKYF